ncbi:thioesterase family protein [Saccharopolyspora erythraea]|uniref:thioesterase family protein n=1 Tax=Saccharopolyspora erythraea TaxID=1836 RepID=UPI001BAD8DE8|nr:thioesterase family protein [Saccharopolyspora erythraea]QUH05305.1 thioesterase family protein [Saccharopolyspora erythraea]
MTDLPDLFTAATAVRSLGDGSFVADLHPDWSVGDRPHGGYLLAMIARAATEGTDLSPLAVSAQFLRAPKTGPVLVRSETLKTGRTVTVRRTTLEQRGQVCVDTTVTLGQVPVEEPAWSDVPDMPVNPPAEALDLSTSDAVKFYNLARTCDVRLDRASAGFLDGDVDQPPRLRLWAKPRGAQPDVLFSLVAGDLTMPVTFNMGRFGWSPTVQLTALLRARPANGWLRLVVDCRSVHGRWFDEDTTVVDSTGRVVCQARQLAISA